MISWLKRNYCWIIILVMMLQTSIYGGLANINTSIYIIPVTTDLGISRSDYSLANSMRALVLFFCTALSGGIFKRFDVKTPCKVDDKCHDCHGDDCMCRGLLVLWGPMRFTTTEVILIDEELGF